MRRRRSKTLFIYYNTGHCIKNVFCIYIKKDISDSIINFSFSYFHSHDNKKKTAGGLWIRSKEEEREEEYNFIYPSLQAVDNS